MVFEEFRQLCRNELWEIAKPSCSSIDRMSYLEDISNKVSSEYGVDGLSFGIVTRNGIEYITYSFGGASHSKSAGGFKFNCSTFESDIGNTMADIVDGYNALRIINDTIENAVDASGEKRSIYYTMSKAKVSSIYYWDYSHIGVKLSEKSTNIILKAFRSSENSFKLLIKSLVAKDGMYKDNIINFIRNFNTYEMHSKFDIVLESNNMSLELSKNMLSRDEAIQYISEFKSKKHLELYVVQIIEQLGVFIALAKWVVDFDSKDVSIYLKDEQVIDATNGEILSNYGICSRIEQILRLNDQEKELMFK